MIHRSNNNNDNGSSSSSNKTKQNKKVVNRIDQNKLLYQMNFHYVKSQAVYTSTNVWLGKFISLYACVREFISKWLNQKGVQEKERELSSCENVTSVCLCIMLSAQLPILVVNCIHMYVCVSLCVCAFCGCAGIHVCTFGNDFKTWLKGRNHGLSDATSIT